MDTGHFDTVTAGSMLLSRRAKASVSGNLGTPIEEAPGLNEGFFLGDVEVAGGGLFEERGFIAVPLDKALPCFIQHVGGELGARCVKLELSGGNLNSASVAELKGVASDVVNQERGQRHLCALLVWAPCGQRVGVWIDEGHQADPPKAPVVALRFCFELVDVVRLQARVHGNPKEGQAVLPFPETQQAPFNVATNPEATERHSDALDGRTKGTARFALA